MDFKRLTLEQVSNTLCANLLAQHYRNLPNQVYGYRGYLLVHDEEGDWLIDTDDTDSYTDWKTNYYAITEGWISFSEVCCGRFTTYCRKTWPILCGSEYELD